MSKIRPIALAALILLGVTACGQPSLPEGHLSRALTFVPNNASEFMYTDWALIKKYKDVADLTSRSDMEKRREFMLSIGKDQAGASGYALARFFQHAEAWGWDSTDLIWETMLMYDGAPPAYVLRLRDDFDTTAIVRRFDERGFTQSQHNGATIYSHEMDLTADWLRLTEFGILNTAVVADEKTLVLSTSIDNVKAIVDAYRDQSRSSGGETAFQAIADRLGEVAAAALSRAEVVCRSLNEANISAQTEAVKAILGPAPALHAYQAFGIGYRYENEKPIGLLVFHYANAADAQADLDARRRLADEATSLSTRQPYSVALFTLNQALVDGSDLTLQVSPVNDLPRRLFDMVRRRDVIFAVCPQ